jgi:hypothetical protein
MRLQEGHFDIKGKLNGTEDLNTMFSKMDGLTGVEFYKDFKDLNIDKNN